MSQKTKKKELTGQQAPSGPEKSEYYSWCEYMNALG